MAQLELLDVDTEQVLTSPAVLDVFASVRLVTKRAPARLRPRSGLQLRFTIAALLDTLEPDFIPELLKQTRQRAAGDSIFAAQLAESRAEIERLIPKVAALREAELAAVSTELEDHDDPPVVFLTDEEGAKLGLAVVIVLFVVLTVAAWIASEDPGKDDEAEEDDGGGGGQDGDEDPQTPT
jgi:hypothetical protein